MLEQTLPGVKTNVLETRAFIYLLDASERPQSAGIEVTPIRKIGHQPEK